MKLPELTAGEITKSALEQLRWEGFVVWRQNQIPVPGRRFTGKKGQADIIGFHQTTGKFLACEVKKMGDTLKDDQIEFLNQAKKAGAIVLIATQDKQTGQMVIKEFAT